MPNLSSDQISAILSGKPVIKRQIHNFSLHDRVKLNEKQAGHKEGSTGEVVEFDKWNRIGIKLDKYPTLVRFFHHSEVDKT